MIQIPNSAFWTVIPFAFEDVYSDKVITVWDFIARMNGDYVRLLDEGSHRRDAKDNLGPSDVCVQNAPLIPCACARNYSYHFKAFRSVRRVLESLVVATFLGQLVFMHPRPPRDTEEGGR